MKKKNITLERETLRRLGTRDLANVAGGYLTALSATPRVCVTTIPVDNTVPKLPPP
jgi:hypothetical protein